MGVGFVCVAVVAKICFAKPLFLPQTGNLLTPPYFGFALYRPGITYADPKQIMF